MTSPDILSYVTHYSPSLTFRLPHFTLKPAKNQGRMMKSAVVCGVLFILFFVARTEAGNFLEKIFPLEELAERIVLGHTVSQVQAYAKEYDIQFNQIISAHDTWLSYDLLIQDHPPTEYVRAVLYVGLLEGKARCVYYTFYAQDRQIITARRGVCPP